MWICTLDGFFSAVEDPEDNHFVQVRSRVVDDSRALADWMSRKRGYEYEVHQWPGRDYPSRVIVLKADWVEYLMEAGWNISYPNFKDEVTRRQGRARHDVYARVWHALLSLESFNRTRPLRPETSQPRKKARKKSA